jgi:hypothetical protein
MSEMAKLQSDFMSVVVGNKDYSKALEILNDNNADFTMYSCTNDIIGKVIKATDDELKDLIELINKANTDELYIHDIVIKRNKVDALQQFFTSFDDINTKERLFVLLGETGVGKSYIIEQRYPNMVQYACNRALDVFSLCYYTDDKERNGAMAQYETPFLKALKSGGQVFLDEMNELPHETLMFIQGITDEKKSVVIGDEHIHIAPTFRILAALNPPSETDERTPLGDALLGRAVGHVLELTDQMICDRIGKSMKWLLSVRKLHNYVGQSGMIDVRPLSFRDYQRFAKYDFESQFKFKVCMGDVSNIRNYEKLTTTGEYDRLVNEVENAQ